MDLRFSAEDEAFRAELRDWLEGSLGGDFQSVRGRGGPGDEHSMLDERMAWERHLGAHGWTCVGWPREHGGRGCALTQQLIFAEEYARAEGPGRVGHIGETLLGPTLIAFGSEEVQREFLPPITRGEALWCQGYSEPNAGSDLANVQTRARLDGEDWVIEGQKVWTSWAAWADWCFVLCRTDPDVPKHRGLSYLLVPMRQDGVEVRPIVQITGDSEFSEVFFDGARTARSHIVGEPGDGWRVANGTLAFERGISTLSQQLQFRNELDHLIAEARRNGRARDPLLRQRLADAWMGIEIMRYNALRVLAGGEGAELPREGLINKLYWSTLHRDLGELAMDVLGPESDVADGPPYALSAVQRLFLFTRADTLYGGTNEIQCNIIAERALGLPREPRTTSG